MSFIYFPSANHGSQKKAATANASKILPANLVTVISFFMLVPQ